MKVTLDQSKFPITLSGAIEDGPVLTREMGYPWDARITSFRVRMICTGPDRWKIQQFVAIGQEMDKHGNIDPDEFFRVQRRYGTDDCPDWAVRLVERIVSLGLLPQMATREFHIH